MVGLYSSSSRHSGSYSDCVHLAIPNPRHSSSDCQPGPAAHHRRMDTEAAVPAPVPAPLEEPPRQEEIKNEEEEEVKQDLGEKEDFEEMFTSALDSPSDSGLAGLDMETPNSSNDDDVMETPNNSDTLEDLSLQDDDVEVPARGVSPVPDVMEEIAVKEESTQNGDHAVSEVNLNAEEEDDDDDIFKSVRLEPQPNKVAEESNGLSREVSLEPDTDIPLEDDEHPFENAHLKPGLQLSEPELEPATLQPQTLTSFHEEEAKRELENGDEFIEIKVTSPHKVGEGMSSYMAYKIITNTNLSYFKKTKPEVNRRFSDFLGLRDKLSEKYLQNGRIIPPCPDKSVIGMTKVKMSKEDETSVQSEFVEKRRAALERYLNRTATHPNLRVDPDFREFLELDAELPKSNQTAALSGKSVLKLISKVGDRVNQYTTKMEETDQWFEEKSVVVENLDTQLRKLLVATEALVDYRKNLSGHTYSLSKSLGLLGSAEDNSKLATAIAQLAEVEEKVEKVHEQQAKDDFFLLSELVHDHIGLVGAVKDAFSERVKAWQSWQAVQRDLNKRRENKVKAELAGKQDRVNQLRQEIAENERQLDMAQENFEKISRIIKKEYEAFDVKKCKDFKDTMIIYMEKMLKSQESLVTHWDRFLPEIKQLETGA